MEFTFYDLSGYQIKLTFNSSKFSKKPNHVLVVPFYQHYLVMTKHKKRGLELPGGKIEPGEWPLQAAFRETWEETGGILNSIQQIGEYLIADYQGENITKAIYYGQINEFTDLASGFETDGYQLFSLPVDTQQAGFSLFVRDQLFIQIINYLKEQNFYPFQTETV